ncbi:MAG: SprB repeat-containing protein, partial [Bacteroidota bacterium]
VRASAGIESARVVPQDVSTCGGSDGALLVEPLNGAPPYSYFWSGTSSGEATGIDGAFTIPNLAQGTYRVTIIDNSSLDCNIQLPFTTIDGPSANVSLTAVTPTSCNASADGEICIEVQGLNPQIIWNTDDTTACISNLSSGLYSVTVTDGDCETVLTDIAIESPTVIETAANLIMPTCAENNDGTIELVTSGGTAPYRYNWQDLNLNEKTRANLAAGDYIVSILDANDCSFSDTIRLLAPDTLRITRASIQNTTCFELENGVIIPEVEGGTAPYFYEWNTGAFGDTLSNLGNGNYELTVTDVNGCQSDEEFAVNQPDGLAITLDSIQNASCEGVEDGLLRIDATGGSLNYNYQWSNGESGNQIGGLGTGQYKLTVTDENSCTLIDSFLITAPPSIQLTSDLTSPKCVGGRDGAIDLTISNADVAEIMWDDGRTVEDLDRISDGTYYVTITDVNGCTLQDSFVLTAPQLLEVSVTTRSPSCTGSRDGSIQLDVVNQNGLPPDFRWSSGPSTQDLMNIGAGAYTAIVKDRDGCTLETDTIFLNDPEPIVITADKIVSTQCFGEESGSVEISVTGGFPPYEYDWGIASTEDLYDVSAGNYRVAVLDNNGCAAQ